MYLIDHVAELQFVNRCSSCNKTNIQRCRSCYFLFGSCSSPVC